MAMRSQVLEQLKKITSEEQSYLDGSTQVDWEIYTKDTSFAIDPKLLLKDGHLITVRPHSRFVDFPAHSHNYIEMMYVCQGRITHIIDGKELNMQAGDLLMLNQRVIHSIRRADYDDIGVNFIALPEFFSVPLSMLREDNVLADFLVNTLSSRHANAGYLLFSLGQNLFIENLMSNLIMSMHQAQEPLSSYQNMANQYTMGLVFLYLLEHMDRLTRYSSLDYKEVLVQSALRYIQTHFRTASLTKIAADSHQSVSVLSKLIRQKTGHTFKELLQYQRFQQAERLLTETDLSVEEISLAVGYENSSYFFRHFKEQHGVTPRRYRTKYSV